jgi:hypothetical protein
MGRTGRIPVTTTDPRLALMFALTISAVRFVVTAKFTELLPAGIVTLAGTTTKLESDLRLQMVAAAATWVRVTVPVPLVPPAMRLGVNVTVLGTGTFTVRV